jgi:glycine/serine hydroxymethyltransferase
MKEPEMLEIGRLIVEIIHAPQLPDTRKKVPQGVADFTMRFPLYPKRLKQRLSQRGSVGAD